MTADQLRKSILQQAIQGKLIPQDPNDEPASALLERIRKEKARLVKEKKIKKEKNPSIIFRGEDNSHYEKFTLTGEVKCIDDEIPFNLPAAWEWCRLEEFTLIVGGYAFPIRPEKRKVQSCKTKSTELTSRNDRTKSTKEGQKIHATSFFTPYRWYPRYG